MIYDTNLEQCAEVCNLGLTKVMEHCYTYGVHGLLTHKFHLIVDFGNLEVIIARLEKLNSQGK